MSQQHDLSDIVESMLNLIQTQKRELQVGLDLYIEKLSKSCTTTPETDGLTEDYYSQVNLQLFSALNLLLEIKYHVYSAGVSITCSEVQTLPTWTKGHPTDVLKTSSEIQSQKMKTLEMRLKELITCAQDLERRQSEKMSELELHMDGMAENVTSQSANVIHLQQLMNTNFDQLLQSFSDIVEWRDKSDELLNQLATTSDEMEYDVSNVMEGLKELDKGVKAMTLKMDNIESSSRSCTKTVYEIENRLKNLEDRMTTLETTSRKEIRHCKKGLNSLNTKQQLTCQLISTKLHPLTQLQQTLKYLQERYTKDTEFEKKEIQIMETSEKSRSINRIMDRLREIDMIQLEIGQMKSSADQWQFISKTIIFIAALLCFLLRWWVSKNYTPGIYHVIVMCIVSIVINIYCLLSICFITFVPH